MARGDETASLRVLIVDDEPIARRGIRKLLADQITAEVIGECGDGKEAVAAIRRLHPDIVILDVQMPELDGFGVIESVGVATMPPVLFITAYDAYAVRAFDVEAVDYVLKPIDPERFHEAFGRARRRLREDRVDLLRKHLDNVLDRLEDRSARQSTALECMVIKEAGRIFFLDVDEIDWIEAAGNYVKLHVGEATHMQRETMVGLMERLDPREFVRISRSTIVRVDAIRDLSPLFKGGYVIRLKNGTELTSSRRYRGRVEALLDAFG